MADGKKDINTMRRPLPHLALMMLASTIGIVAAGSGRCTAQEPSATVPPFTDEQQVKLTKSLEKALAEAQKQVEADPKSVGALSQRGDAYFFLGNFSKAAADYDQMVTLDDKMGDSHWRRGIAWFYANEFDKAAGQFESYHSFDQVDRENGIWRYLSQYKAHGQAKAREGLLKYEKDDREPFPSVYKLFAGAMKPEEILQQIGKAEISENEREKRLFYAHLYIGLNCAVEGDDVLAQQHLRQSTLNKWGPASGYGPHYMWHVGRLHEQLLRSKMAAEK